jgi:hypothetical protein
MPADADRGAVPEPALCAPVFEPYEVDVPYSNHHVVERPFGVTEPRRLAVEGVIETASPVVTVGVELVTKLASLPAVVPASLVATIRK